MTLWAARVESPPAAEVWDFLRAPDAELLPYDCEASACHARRLAAAGLLSDEELAQVEAALAEIARTRPAPGPGDEDVHSALERLLGPLGLKIHAGRSRNDQVAAALRLYVADACCEADAGIARLAAVLAERARAEAGTPMPGYTHLQRAQPVTVGHHLLAWLEMLERDRRRFALAADASKPSPLGAGALAGSTLPLPPPPGQLANSLDAVADRDFACDYLYACAALFVHLSRIGEEVCLWASSEFGFLRLPQAAATGSSMMPQKLNPDVAELVRGKAGTAIGRLAGLLATVKGLPLAYDRDLQEDKVSLFAARRDVAGALAALALLLAGAEFEHARMAAAAADPLLLATDAAEALVAEGVPFREAHARVAEQVRGGRFAAAGDAAASVAARGRPGPGDAARAAAEACRRLAGDERPC